MAKPAEALAITVTEAIDRLRAHEATSPLLPTAFSERIAGLLIGCACLRCWSRAAKALHNADAAISLYAALFPGDCWLLGRGNASPLYAFAPFRAEAPMELASGAHPEPLCNAHHDICAVAIVIGALERRRQEPLPTTASAADAARPAPGERDC